MSNKMSKICFEIHIQSEYRWGHGMNSGKLDALNAQFRKIFEGKGYTFLHKEERTSLGRLSFAECPVAYSDTASLYLHPMEVSGYGTPEDFNEVQDALIEGGIVIQSSTYLGQLFDGTDEEYVEWLKANRLKEINALIAEMKQKKSDPDSWDAMDIVKKVGLYRPYKGRETGLYESPGTWSGEAAVKFVESLLEAA